MAPRESPRRSDPAIGRDNYYAAGDLVDTLVVTDASWSTCQQNVSYIMEEIPLSP